jgi:hypothetical protein
MFETSKVVPREPSSRELKTITSMRLGNRKEKVICDRETFTGQNTGEKRYQARQNHPFEALTHVTHYPEKA